MATQFSSRAIANAPAGPTWALISLVTGINNGLVFQDDVGGGANTGTWMTDVTGGFGRISYGAGGTPGTAGFRWFGLDPAKQLVYVQYDLRRTSNLNSKELKIFGAGYPTNYSNHTGGCNTGGYAGTDIGNSYSDKTTGGDIDVQFNLDQFPTLTGGTSYSRTPHPTAFVTGGGTESIDGTWHTRGCYWKQNDDSSANGEYAEFLDGVCIFSCNTMWNCRTGGQGFSRIDWGGYSPNVIVEDYRNVYVGYFRPSGTGLP